MRLKKTCFFLALVILAVAAATFVGCDKTTTPAETFDPNALTIMGKTSDLNKPYMQKMFDMYKKATGENLNVLKIEDAKFETEAISKMRSDSAPDILLHFHNSDLSRFDVENEFAYLNDQTWVDDLTKSAKQYCSDTNGNILGLPFWESSVSGCYYNTKLLRGLKAPTAQEDFDGLCDELLKKGITPILWPANGCSWMVQFGLDPIFADNPELLEQINCNQIKYADIPQVKDMMTWLSNAAKKGWFGNINECMNTGWDQISSKLASGEAAMTFIWDTWFDTDFHAGKYSKSDFALMPVFMNTAKGGTYEGGNLNMMMVNKNSDKKDRAIEFLNFCATPENYNVAFDGISTVSVFLGQNTNVQSDMVTAAQKSIEEHERASTANTKVIGYNAEDAANAVKQLLTGQISVDKCIELLDNARIAKAKALGIEGF